MHIVLVIIDSAATTNNIPAPNRMSTAITQSWKDPAIRARRIARIPVQVKWREKNNEKVALYSSVRKAFLELNLPLKKHRIFRGELRNEKRKPITSENGTIYTFQIDFES